MGDGVRNENRILSTSPQDSSLLYSSHSSDHQHSDSGRDESPLSSMGECGSRPSVRETSVEAEQGSQEARHPTQDGEGRERTQYAQLDEGFAPITTYPSDLPEEIPWESGIQQMTLESCRAHYDKLQNDLSSLDLALENKQRIEMVLQ